MTNSSFGGATGITRLFSQEMALQISWLLPAALISLVAGLWLTRRAPRIDLTRAALILWGGWLLVTGLVFSYMQGTIHPYYTIALAPAIGGLILTTGSILWRQRETLFARVVGALLIASTAAWSYHLLSTTTWMPALRYIVLAAGVIGVLAVIGAARVTRVAVVGVVAAAVVGLGGAGAYAAATATVAHTGSTPSVGASSTSSGGFGGGGSGTRPSGSGPTGTGGTGGPGGTPPGSTSSSTSTSGTSGSTGTAPTGTTGGGDSSSNSALTALLKASTTKWAAAASSSMTAGSLELESGKAVMSIGGFNGSDDAISLTQFEALVKAGKIHYFIAEGTTGGGGGGGGTYSQIATWVSAHYTAKTVGGTTVYDLTAAAK